jgi:hypothetical protein
VTYLNSGENACYDCPTGCSNCTSDIKCGGCIDDYYFDQSLELSVMSNARVVLDQAWISVKIANILSSSESTNASI